MMSVSLLWILAAVSALAFSALALAHTARARGKYAIDEPKVISLAHMVSLLERSADFKTEEERRTYATGTVALKRTFADDKTLSRLALTVESGTVRKQIEVGWKKIAGEWRAAYWREW